MGKRIEVNSGARKYGRNENVGEVYCEEKERRGKENEECDGREQKGKRKWNRRDRL